MSKRKQAEKISSFIGLAERLRHERYRLAVALGPASSGKSQIARVVSHQLQAHYIDLATDLLPQIVMPNFSPTLGAYDARDFKNWILDASYKPDVNYIIVDNPEPLLATFGRAKTAEFLQIISLIEPLAPVILVTYLSKQIETSNFPSERLLSL